MRFTVKTSLFRSALARLEALYANALGLWNMEIAISTKSTGGAIVVECAGGGVYYCEIVEADVVEDGHFSVPISTLSALHFPGGTITFLIKDSALAFKSDRMNGKLEQVSTRKSTQVPAAFQGNTALKIPAKLFNDLVESIGFKPTVAGTEMKVRFVANNSKQRLRVYCADTWRLARYEWCAETGAIEAPKTAKPSKRSEAEESESVATEITGDFDYVFDSKFLHSISSFFNGNLEIAADAKTIKFWDGSVLLFCPSLQEDIGAQVDSLIASQKKEEPVAEIRLHPGHALNLIKSACSISKDDNTSLSMTSQTENKTILVRVAGEGAKTQCSLDLIAIRGKDTQVSLHATHFGEFLDRIRSWSDEKKGCTFKIWPKLIGLFTKESAYMMPTMD